MGYTRKGSKASLIAGVSIGILYAISGYMLQQNMDYAHETALGTLYELDTEYINFLCSHVGRSDFWYGQTRHEDTWRIASGFKHAWPRQYGISREKGVRIQVRPVIEFTRQMSNVSISSARASTVSRSLSFPLDSSVASSTSVASTS